MFMGIAVVAGFFCILAEICAIVSLFTFQKPKAAYNSSGGSSRRGRKGRGKRAAAGDRNESGADADTDTEGPSDGSWELYLKQLHAMLVVMMITNMGYFSAAAVFPVFLLSGVTWAELVPQWGAAVVSQFMFPIAFAYCRAK